MADKEWADYFPYNNTKNFKSSTFEEPTYGANDVIDLASKVNFSYFDNQTTYPEYSNFTTDDYCTSNYSHFYLNVTCEIPINYAEPMYGYIAPFLLATTTVANTLIVVVLSRRHMRTPTNVVLMAMALCDMFTMLFPAPWLFYMYTFGNHYKPLSPVAACKAWNYMNEVSGDHTF
ncbi:sex peptide receptor-like [Choristoneura fumiferana]|uniref:sex peptide receptor-like n=1 Tax=Choristoneura fumiferana TaxID=7141 RepID=UPI003D15E1B0